jgi:hypothetical protein
MLGWMLNPSENHGLGDAFLKGILQSIIERDAEDKYDVFKILLMDLYGFTVAREWRNIDILLVSEDEKMVIAVENKVGTSEHDDQLNRYRNILEQEYPDYKRIFVFLTPDGDNPSDPKNWSVLTYNDVLNVLNGILDRMRLNPDVELMIKNYVDILRRDIVEDKELAEICDKIYKKHQKALDLIFEYRMDGRGQVSEIVREILKEEADKGRILYQDGWNLNFRTEILNRLLPEPSEKITTWGAYYWFKIDNRGESFWGYLEVFMGKVPESSAENMEKMISKLKPKDTNSGSVGCKKLITTKKYTIPELDEENWDSKVRAKVREAIDWMLEKERVLQDC